MSFQWSHYNYVNEKRYQNYVTKIFHFSQERRQRKMSGRGTKRKNWNLWL